VKNNEKDIDLTPIEIPAVELTPTINLLIHLNHKTDNKMKAQVIRTLTIKTEKLLFKCDYFGCDKAFRSAIESIKRS
jgi:hypothetical protein